MDPSTPYRHERVSDNMHYAWRILKRSVDYLSAARRVAATTDQANEVVRPTAKAGVVSPLAYGVATAALSRHNGFCRDAYKGLITATHDYEAYYSLYEERRVIYPRYAEILRGDAMGIIIAVLAEAAPHPGDHLYTRPEQEHIEAIFSNAFQLKKHSGVYTVQVLEGDGLNKRIRLRAGAYERPYHRAGGAQRTPHAAGR